MRFAVVLPALLVTALACAHVFARTRATCAAPVKWPLWEAYAARFVADDGRVIDRTEGDRSTSEGQAYALFFSLVANDRQRFDRILSWTRDNLAGGDLAKNLPGWKWGRGDGGEWRLLDPNPASDADLWIGYVLLEASRLWQMKEYEALARAVLGNVFREEVRELPGLGAMLLPAPFGFGQRANEAWRLNPSYLPPQILRRLHAAKVPGPWADVLEGSVRMLAQTTPHGFASDWVIFEREQGFSVDPASGGMGSYDAIRVYLWLGMLDASDPLRRRISERIAGPWRYWTTRAQVPERVHAPSGKVASVDSPPGFLAVLLPEARSRETAAVEMLLAQLDALRVDGLYGRPPAYYDQNLALFGVGFVEERFGFEADGQLRTAWDVACAGR